ncbi:hypothetical protein [Pseudaminobacter salicylatoxidans]|uniref:hypothetical protein n=1 Tax=Pseudaminobacter salicylatoxidans TaxID=93369 RepID=UPI001472AA3E|nr:hypothetical protein [Pseudaminobacter salicylatoxidans]
MAVSLDAATIAFHASAGLMIAGIWSAMTFGNAVVRQAVVFEAWSMPKTHPYL